jgi:hypothetical protein
MSEAADPNAKRRLRRLVVSFALLVVGGVMYDAAMTFGLGPTKNPGWNAVAAETLLGDYSDPNNRFAWNVFGLASLVLVGMGFLGTTFFLSAFVLRRMLTGRWT